MANISTDHPTLLVLDVHSVWLRAVERIGQEAGFATMTTSSTSEAFKLLRRGGFDIVMCGVDAGGENLSWTELLARSKKLAPSAKYILVADEDDQDVLQRAVGAGADAYITRRVEPEDLVFAIRQVLAPALYLIWPFSGSGRSGIKGAGVLRARAARARRSSCLRRAVRTQRSRRPWASRSRPSRGTCGASTKSSACRTGRLRHGWSRSQGAAERAAPRRREAAADPGIANPGGRASSGSSGRAEQTSKRVDQRVSRRDQPLRGSGG